MLRATADDPQLAQARGIDTGRVLAWAWVLSGAFAALGGCLLGLETFVRPSLGLSVLLPVLAAATLGGLGRPAGAVVGGLAVAAAQNVVIYVNWGGIFGGDWQISSTYKSAVALCVFVAVLLWRPHGLLPAEERRRG